MIRRQYPGGASERAGKNARLKSLLFRADGKSCSALRFGKRQTPMRIRIDSLAIHSTVLIVDVS